MTTRTSDATMAVFLDLENIALGARDAKYPSFDIEKVLERLIHTKLKAEFGQHL